MKSNIFLIWLIFNIIILSACAFNPGINGSVKPHPNHDGLYLVYFRYSEFIEEHTAGWDTLRSTVANAEGISNKLAVWQNAINKAMPVYLSKNNMTPKECIQGINMISSNQDENGGGVAVFKCAAVVPAHNKSFKRDLNIPR